eukprot:3410229-Rhodomonas_salina.1
MGEKGVETVCLRAHSMPTAFPSLCARAQLRVLARAVVSGAEGEGEVDAAGDPGKGGGGVKVEGSGVHCGGQGS